MSRVLLSLAILLSSSLSALVCGNEASQLKTYIVRVRGPSNATQASPQRLETWYGSFLPESAANSSEPRIIYSYSEAMSGFAARLTEAEIEEMANMDGLLKAYPDRTLSLFTTHTPSFLGLSNVDISKGLWQRSALGKGAIIGVLDGGVSAAHPSFDDDGMAPPPHRWKGTCVHGGTFRCNKKLIGALSFVSKRPPVDQDGHGTHTSSTAAGNFVYNANVLGNGNGTASGMAPRAHLAIYQVCQDEGCNTSDVLAGMDAAIKDGVDVISLSLGGLPANFYDDPLSMAAFAAADKGIFVSCAGGNDGPRLGTITNSAPWVLTVAASTMDRSIRATVKLGDGQEFDGQSVFQPEDFSSAMLPLVLPNVHDDARPGNCISVNSSHVEGKIVLCHMEDVSLRMDYGVKVLTAGGAAVILMNNQKDGYTTLAEPHLLPASHVSYADGSKILSYITSSGTPAASIMFKGTIIGVSPHPFIASFSSRGPNKPSPGILKPDVTGPGVNIIAAWPFKVGPPNASHGKLNFSTLSGTSMSTPHLSGIAALVKCVHPDWSPAAIITTADIVDNKQERIKDEQLQPASSFLMGSGHVKPSKVADPGLVYDLNTDDYIPYLCGLGYTDKEVEYVTGRKIACANTSKIKEVELNYPSITVSLKSGGSIRLTRTVTNVGKAESVYKAEVEMPKGVSITVQPEVLQFKEVNEKKSFTVAVSGKASRVQEGGLKWVSSDYVVRSPVIMLPSSLAAVGPLSL